MRYIVVRKEKATGNTVEQIKKFASLTAACKFCRKMNGHLTLESRLRVFFYAPEAINNLNKGE